MMLFGKIIPLESKNQEEDNISAIAQVSIEVEGTKTETEIEAKKTDTEAEADVENEAQQEKAFIVEQKEHNQCGSANIFNSNNDFQCVGTQNDYEEELNFLEAWHTTPCLDKVCIEAA